MKPVATFEYEPGVSVKVYHEDDPDWSWVEDDKTKRMIARGDLEQYIVVVSVFDKSGEVEGSDSLGGIVVGFDDHKQEIRDAIEANEMVANALDDLKAKLTRIIESNKAGA